MHDQSKDHADQPVGPPSDPQWEPGMPAAPQHGQWVQGAPGLPHEGLFAPVSYPPPGQDNGFPPLPVNPVVPQRSRLRRGWVWASLAAVIALAVAAVIGVRVLTREEAVAFPVGNCVAMDAATPVEYGCQDSKSLYRIVGREDIVYPPESACLKYSDATRAVTAPVAQGAKADTVLCLAPTRFHKTDPGALQAGDCIDVKESGGSMTVVPCDSKSLPAKVLATELHPKIPVITRACENTPEARMAFGQASLGGRAIVVCAVPTDPKDMDNAKVGDCAAYESMSLVACTDPSATQRVLSVKTVFQKPAKPECAGLHGANSSFTTANEKTDLVMLVCMGPADQKDSLYSVVGECIGSGGGNSRSASSTFRVECSDPSAKYVVSERIDSENAECETPAKLTYSPGVTLGLTICLARR
ncbi:hypothetical protein JK358_32310 [Nocardia sp. 2]|uniref:Uncharacterized protein n=1 Tax=Nocardia acididurans TaxID=2802282 RepID=A0ABS1MEP6_9NOCA|nr:hypothetical protein [Nocardia acididurans]MBL1079098.1 hypothetical protein [Nocardia acididurans]